MCTGFLRGLAIALLCLGVFSLLSTCGGSRNEAHQGGDISGDSLHAEVFQWEGDKRSVEAAGRLFSFLGDREQWVGMESLYLHYQQQDEAFGAYPSIQIQSLTEDKIIVDQYIKDRRFIRILDYDLAWIINDGDIAEMDETNRQFLVYWLHLDFYRNIHTLAVGKGLRVLFTNEYRLFVTKGEEFLFALQLDQDFRPTIFQRPRFNDQNISLRLLEWSQADGFRYPTHGAAVDGDFTFTVLDFVPGYSTPEEAFEVPFNPEYLDVVFEYGIKPF